MRGKVRSLLMFLRSLLATVEMDLNSGTHTNL